VASNLSLGSDIIDHRVFAGSPDARQHSFEPNHPGVRIRAVIRHHHTEAAVTGVGFPVPFGAPALACCVIPSPLRPSALLTVGLPGHLGPDLNGIATFRRYKTRSGWASPLSRGGGVLPTDRA
jgi:hypothetical protein